MIAHGQLVAAQADLDGLARRAVLDGVVDQVADRALETRADAGDDASVRDRDERRVRASGGARARRLLADQQVQAHVLGVRARLLAARQVDQVVHQQRQLLDLLDHVVEQAPAIVERPCPRPAGGSRCSCAGS